MSVLIFLVVVAATAGYFFWGKMQTPQKSVSSTKKTSQPNKTSKPKSAQQDYRCVVIKAGLMQCKAVDKYKSKRLLTSEAPMLPVPGCDSTECQCKFVRYEDRRRGDRRTIIKSAAGQILSEHENKRVKTDRRKAKRP